MTTNTDLKKKKSSFVTYNDAEIKEINDIKNSEIVEEAKAETGEEEDDDDNDEIQIGIEEGDEEV
jgi:hypothetical protein